MSFKTSLKQQATYWAPDAKDLFGKRTFAAPVQLMCRWEDSNELILNSKGEEKVAKSRIYFAVDVEITGYLFLGNSSASDPTEVEGADEIQSLKRTPDLRNLETLIAAWV